MSTIGALSSGLSSSGSSLTSGLTGTNTNSNAGSDLANTLGGTTGSSTSSDLSNALGGNNSASAIGDSTSAALQAISNQIAALGASQASSNAQEFDKTTTDVLYDNNATARAIGQLRLNTTRLNVISALTAKDSVDTFTFTASTSGATKLGTLVNDPTASDPNADASASLRIQVFSKGQGLIADSDPGSGVNYTNYQALKAGTFDMARGQYTIRVTRADGVDTPQKNSYNYAVQLNQGTTFTQDYTTTEQAFDPSSDDPYGLSNTGNDPGSILSDAMADAYSFVSSLPAIGTSGTSKLLGFIYSTSA
jgi:hypothetical protein